MAASIDNPAVVSKSLALKNDTALDVKKAELEDAEIVKTLASLPNGHPSANALNARRGAIATGKKNHE